MLCKTNLERLLQCRKTKLSTFEAMQRLDANLGHPHQSFDSIHIGGTNGKGSTCYKIARSLELAGFRVGLYTSPHLYHFQERIQINGIPIPLDRIEVLLGRVFSFATEALSFFDLTTALSFLYFQEQKVDWAVIEVGMGGRLDATNVLIPKLSAVTSIGLDHQEILGATLEVIASEKGGIQKKDIPFFVGPTAAPFFPKAKLIPVKPHSFYDEENRQMAAFLLDTLSIDPKAIRQGTSQRPWGRFEVHEGIVLDGAHNRAAIEKLLQALTYHYPHRAFHFLTAFSKDKETGSSLSLLKDAGKLVTSLQIEHPLLEQPKGALTIEEALDLEPKCLQVACGSFHLLDEMRKVLGKRGRLIQRS